MKTKHLVGLITLIVVSSALCAASQQGQHVKNLSRQVITSQKDRWFGRAAVEITDDGTWVLLYREGSIHYVNDGVLHIRFSNDQGKTWSGADRLLDGSEVKDFPAHPPGAAPEDPTGPGEPWLYTTPDGSLVLHCWKVRYSKPSLNKGTWQLISSDGGRTWGEWSQVDFEGIESDSNVFATDDHFVVNRTLYAGARQWQKGRWKNMLIRSQDNGKTWEKVSDISSYAHNTSEVGLEYLGDDTILAVMNTKNREKVYRAWSRDMGESWEDLHEIQEQTQIWDRCRIWTASHVRGEPEWWKGSLILGVGDRAVVPGQSTPRRNALWVSEDRGKTWSGPQHLDEQTKDAGYGDLLYASDRGRYVFVSYHGTMHEAELVQYEFRLD